MFDLLSWSIIGLIFLFIGWCIWKKEAITFLHSYHYKNVSENDKKAYTTEMGKALTLLGVGMIGTGIINFATHTPYGVICFLICFVSAFIKMHMAQKKYNGSWFS